MWQPEPGWHALPGGTGTSTVGVWRAVLGDRPVAVKRLAAPAEHDPAELSDRRHFAYWRRAADVVTSGIVAATPGLRAPARRVGRGGRRRHHPRPGLGRGRRQQRAVRRARAWAGSPAPTSATPRGWPAASSATGWSGSSAAAAGRRWPGPRSPTWPTTCGDAASACLDALDALTQVPQHGDPVPANLPGPRGRRGGRHRLGDARPRAGRCGPRLLRALGARGVRAAARRLPDGAARTAWPPASEVALGARVTAVYTVLTRADWALARVAAGEGALAAKYRHPAVAPYLRALQRQFPQIEALLWAESRARATRRRTCRRPRGCPARSRS